MKNIILTSSRLFQTILFITLSCSIAFAQKTFEGKVTGEMTWENVPANMKAFLSNSTYTTYYKKDKTRTETSSSTSSSIIIEDYVQGKRLLLMTMTIGVIKQKTATITSLIPPNPEKFNLEKFEEYKTINSYNCQKTITTAVVNGKATKTTCFVHNDFIVNLALLPSGPVYMGLPIELSVPTEAGTSTMTVQQLSEEPVSDELFSLAIPKGYKLIEVPAQTNNSIVTNPSNNTPAPVKKVEAPVEKKYTNVSDADLKKLLDAALAKEDFDTAQSIKNEMDARKKASAGKYGAYSTVELTKMLNEAVSKEDYAAAEEIKKELDNRKK